VKYRHYRRPVRRYSAVVLRSKLKSERNQKMGKVLAYAGSLAAVFCAVYISWNALAGFFSTSERFNLREIKILGAKNVSKSEIAALLPFRQGDNLFDIWVSEAERNLSQCKPELENISVRRGWQKVTVSFDERVPIAYVFIDGEKLGVDVKNKIFPLRGGFTKKSLPKIACSDAEQRMAVIKFIVQYKSLAKDSFKDTVGVGIEQDGCIYFDLAEGPRVMWGVPDRDILKEKYGKLKYVLEDSKAKFSRLEYVNLNFFEQGRIIIKPRVNGISSLSQAKAVS